LIYTGGLLQSVYTDGITDGKFEIKKKGSSLTWKFLRVILPTESPKDSNRQLRTVTWSIHRQNCRWNHRGIQTGIFIQWRDRFTVRMANGIIDISSPLVIPSAKVNIGPLCRPSPISPSSFPSQLSPTANNQPPSQKKISLFSAQVIFL
jgi:hypothetical protein